MRIPGLFVSLLLVVPLVATAQQEKDAHFLTERLAPAAHRSTFIHGYLHGYEEGFHEADFDLHMGRIARGDYNHDPKPAGYRKHFGPKRMYEAGFKEGFRVGYADSAAGRSFRAIQNVVAAVANDETAAVSEDLTYDEGVSQGYRAGQSQGLNDARNQHGQNPVPACSVKNVEAKSDFCGAYTSGYTMGYADGLVNQTKTVVAEAK